MVPRPTITTRTATLFPYTTLPRSRSVAGAGRAVAAGAVLLVQRGRARQVRRVVRAARHRIRLQQRLGQRARLAFDLRSEEHTSELQSLMRISYAVFCLKKKTITNEHTYIQNNRTHYIINRPHYNSKE